MNRTLFTVGLILLSSGGFILWWKFAQPIAIVGLFLIIFGAIVTLGSFLEKKKKDKTIYNTEEF
jgi:hypothetical protein